MIDTVLRVENIEYKYPDGYRAIKNMSFEVKEGEKLGIIGANGAGKSTMLRMLVGLLVTDQGKIIVDGIEINKKNLKNIRKKIGFVFQDSDNQLFMNTVYEDIAFGLRSSGKNEDEVNQKVNIILKEMSIEDLKDKQVYKLSGGEKKAVAVAGIMVMEPHIILMDEPTTALDPRARRRVINLIKELPQTNIIATHDLDMILECCDRVLILSEGKIVAEGETKKILSDEKLMNKSNLELPLSLIYKK